MKVTIKKFISNDTIVDARIETVGSQVKVFIGRLPLVLTQNDHGYETPDGLCFLSIQEVIDHINL